MSHSSYYPAANASHRSYSGINQADLISCTVLGCFNLWEQLEKAVKQEPGFIEGVNDPGAISALFDERPHTHSGGSQAS